MKVLVGLSGGVDSAVAAYLLQQQGYEVCCAFMRNWDSMTNQDFLGNPTVNDDICPQEQDYLDAKSVADSLGLELLRVDFVKEYWDYVFTSFLAEYEKGRTPNPDILCNKYIKFASFFEFAKTKGFETVATGHYARIIEKDGEYFLGKGKDINKDQSYFLAQIPRTVLANTLFPLGEIEKTKVRDIANSLNLSIAMKKDSTGICFIGERDFREFLKNYLPAKSGDIIDVDSNKVLGQHEGVLYYTIGQRKGLNIGGVGGPWFVVGKDVAKNELYVAAKEDNKWLISDSCIVENMNWLCQSPNSEFSCMAKFRYRQKDHSVTVEIVSADKVKVKYPQGIPAVTPGQEAVFYQGDVCLGGGVIEISYHQGIDVAANIMEELYGKDNREKKSSQ